MPRTRSTATADVPAVTEPSANGTAATNASRAVPSVRPETCDALSPWGTRCSFDVHSGHHSWQGEKAPDDPKAAPGQDQAGAEAPAIGTEVGQAELPGTPEPEPDNFSVPFESQFNNRDLLDAPGLKEIGERLIETATEQDAFDHLRGIEIHWFWKRRGGTQGGNPRYAGIKRPSSFEKHYTGGRVIYLLWLAADHVRDAQFTPEQIEACLYDQLTRTDVDPDDHDAYRIIGPDFVGSIRTLQRWGVWNQDLKEAAARIQQLPLVQLDEDEEPSEDDEGEESE